MHSKHAVEETANQVIIDVFEEFAFLFPIPCDSGEITADPEEAVLASISFSGQEDGRLRLVVPENMCTEVAGNVMGTDASDERSTECRHDAVKEMLNVSCGQFLTRYFGEEPVFELSPPTVKKIDGEKWRQLKAKESICTYTMLEGDLLFEVLLEGE